MDDGARFIDPNLIYAGWSLELPGLPAPSVPSEPTSAGPTPTSTPKTVTQAPSTAVPTLPRPEPRPPSDPGSRPFSAGSTKKAVTPTTDRTRRSPSMVRHAGDAGAGGAEHSHQSADDDDSSPMATQVEKEAGEPLVHWVPEAAALGISALVAAAYLRRIRRRRSQIRAARGDGEIVVAPTAAAVALEARLAPFAGAPALEWLELANRHLSGPCAVKASQIWRRRSRWSGWAPPGWSFSSMRRWTGRREPSVWPTKGTPGCLVPMSTERHCGRMPATSWPGYPYWCPLGDDPSGTYLLHLEPGQEVALEGPEAAAMLAAWAEAAKSWPWAEQVSVAHDAESAESLAPLFAGQISVDERGTVMFGGDPGALSEEARKTVATVTLEPSDTTTRVVTTSERAFVEPFGITVRPCALDAQSAAGARRHL